MSLNERAWLGLALLALAMGLLLFLPAGTVHYWQAWVYLVIFFCAAAFTTAYLMRTDPALLRRPLKGGPTAETRPAEKLIMLATAAGIYGAAHRSSARPSLLLIRPPD